MQGICPDYRIEWRQDKFGPDGNSFEIFGYDILLDSDLKPWLLEVNGSPSLDASDEEDFALKEQLISESIDILFGSTGSSNFFELLQPP